MLPIKPQLREGERKPLSLAEKLRQTLPQQLGGSAGGINFGADTCLLLDVSGSMSDALESGDAKIVELERLADDFTEVKKYAFNHSVRELKKDEKVGYASGGTNLTLALKVIKGDGVKHCILITDGKPDNPMTALQEAKGLKIDIFYVGPDPAPEFLRQLALASGGTYNKASLDMRMALTGSIRKMLEAPKGPISL